MQSPLPNRNELVLHTGQLKLVVSRHVAQLALHSINKIIIKEMRITNALASNLNISCRAYACWGDSDQITSCIARLAVVRCRQT